MMKNIIQEFKSFIFRGNVISLAVGLIIGAAFQEIVASMTENILSPIIGLFIGRNFDALEWHVLGVSIRYGAFLTSVMNFFILALVVFFIVRSMNKLLAAKERKEADEVKEAERLCSFCMVAVHQNATRCHACTSVL